MEKTWILSLRRLQAEHAKWMRRNFGGHIEPWRTLLGLVEELGEIAHAFLKRRDGIRVSEDHLTKIRDGTGDLIIFLAGFATTMGFDLEDAVGETWDKVKRRDWRKHPNDGRRK